MNAISKSSKIRVKLEKENDDDKQQFEFYDLGVDSKNKEKRENDKREDDKRLINELLSIKEKHSNMSFELATTKRALEAKELELQALRKRRQNH